MDAYELTRRVVRRLIREGGGNFADLAVHVTDSGTSKYAYLYSPDELRRLFNTLLKFKVRVADMPVKTFDEWVSLTSEGAKYYVSPDVVSDFTWGFVQGGVMKGFLRIESPVSRERGPCRGAWEVTHAAVSRKGYGKALYGVGYALSPTGLLMPDRTTVSPDAIAGWKKQSGRPRERFDPIQAPQTPPPEDDCEVHPPGDDHLNFSYGQEGWEVGHLRALSSAHAEVMEELGPVLGRYALAAFKAAINPFWDRYYNEPN